MGKIFSTKYKRYLMIFITTTLFFWWISNTYGWGKVGVLSIMDSYFRDLIIAGILLFFFTFKVVKLWAYFSVVYIPMTFIWIIFIAPRYATALFTTKDELSDIFGVLYLAISLIIALAVTIHDKMKNQGV